MNVGPSGTEQLEVSRVETARLGFTQSNLNLRAAGTQSCSTAARNLGKGIEHGSHHAADAGPHQGIRAGRCLAVVATGFERDVQGRSSGRCAGGSQSVDLGVGPAEL